MNRRRVVILVGAVAFVLALGVVAFWGHRRMSRARVIQGAIADPRHIDPERLLDDIDNAFRRMGDAERQALLRDPEATERRVAEATSRELESSFRLLFMLPAPLRQKVIRESAENLRRKARENPGQVDEFFGSPGGAGALRGASSFFVLGLSGRQKSESAPLTQAMFEIIRDQRRKELGP